MEPSKLFSGSNPRGFALKKYLDGENPQRIGLKKYLDSQNPDRMILEKPFLMKIFADSS